MHFVAKALALDESGNALVLRRTKTHHDMALQPDLPGGNIEKDETPAQAVCREVEEETGLQIASDRTALFYASTNFYKGKSITRFVFVARVEGAKPEVRIAPDEHDSYEWQPLATAVGLLVHPIYRAAGEYLLEHDILGSLQV